jgi:hypothetical protein
MSQNDSRDSENNTTEASQDASAPAAPALGRRDILKYGGLAFAAACLPEWLPGCGSSAQSPTQSGENLGKTLEALSIDLDPSVVDSAWFEVVRPQDMLRVRMNFVQLRHDVPSNTLQVNAPDAGAGSNVGVILIEFPGQHIDEQTVSETATTPPPTPPVGAQMAGPSRIAFVVPSGTTVPYTLSGLLDACTKLQLNVPANALPALDDTLTTTSTPATATDAETAIANLAKVSTVRGKTDATSDATPPADTFPPSSTPAPAAPKKSQTSIELPYRVMVSPSSNLRFAHSSTPYQASSTTLTELWTTRLARATSSGPPDDTARVPVSARAVWSPDWPTPATDPVSNPTFPPNLRAALVSQTSDFSAATSTQPTIPFHARRLVLSSRGGSLDAFADFPTPIGGTTAPTLLNWQHRASYGRDNYVRVEQSGMLFPWGHAASLVLISNRKFLANANSVGGARTAYLWQKAFLIIRQPVVDYLTPSKFNTYAEVYTSSGLSNWAFKQIRILTPSTPPLDAPPSPLTRFWPTINGGTAFRFSAQFVDLEDNVSTTELAAIWLPDPNSSTDVDASVTDFSAATSVDAGVPRNTCDFRRQRVAYVPPATGTTGTTAHETQIMTFYGQDMGESFPLFVPFIKKTQVNIPAVRQFSGKDEPITLEYAKTYLTNGFQSANKGEVYLSATDSTASHIDFGSQSQKGGGFLTPSMAIIGMSRAAGPISGSTATDIKTQMDAFGTNGGNDPTQLFVSALSKAKLFGVFSLGQLFGNATGTILPPERLPKFATEFLDIVGTFVRTLTQLQDALKTLQTLAASTSNLPSALSGQVNSLGGHVSALAADLCNFPPTATMTEVQAIGADITAIQGSITTAWSTNNSLPLGPPRIPDVVFSQLTSLLRSASSIANSSQIGTALSAASSLAQAAANMTSHFTWQTKAGDIKSIDVSSSITKVFDPSPTDTVLKVVGEVRAHDVAGKPAGLDLTATLNDFNINLVGNSGDFYFFQLVFDHLSFATLAGQKPSVDVGFKTLNFKGPIRFLESLKSLIPLKGFSDPPAISITSRGIEANLQIALPALSVGVFTLENINLGASLEIPFIGEPMTVGFHFATKDNPFHLTVSLLGGGGYFGLDLSLQGVILVEAALEFGAEASVNFVVASGTILVMGGVYFAYMPAGTPPGVNLTGYVRMAGSLSVLGLITTSVEMRMDLSYHSADKSAHGEASISVEVSVLFFSESVDIHCEKTFSSCNADPIFADQMGPGTPGGPWATYIAAFAA